MRARAAGDIVRERAAIGSRCVQNSKRELIGETERSCSSWARTTVNVDIVVVLHDTLRC
jgi:hypothetical protein